MTTINTQIAQAKANLAKLEEAKRQAVQLEVQKQQVLSQVDEQVQRKAKLNEHLIIVIEATKPKVERERELSSSVNQLKLQHQELQKQITQKEVELHNLRQDMQVNLANALLPIVQLEIPRTAQMDSIGDISHAHKIQSAISARVKEVLKNITAELA